MSSSPTYNNPYIQTPRSQYQFQQLARSYYQLNLQVSTLQKHILKLQTSKQEQYKFFNDQVEKLKLYIDQCQNQIKKRQQRQVLLLEQISRLKQSNENSRQNLDQRNEVQQQVQYLQSALTHYKQQQQLKAEQWNYQRSRLFQQYQASLTLNLELEKKIFQLSKLLESKETFFKGQISLNESMIKKALQQKQKQLDVLRQQNQELRRLMSSMRMDGSQKPLSISSSCWNCLRISKIHSIQLQDKKRQIDQLKKDMQGLLGFFH